MTYTDIEKVIVAAIGIECVLGELRETPYEPMKEEEDETMFGDPTTDRQLHVLNEIFINFFGKGIDGKVGLNTTFFANINNHCLLCCSKEYTASSCLKLVNTRPKCAKCKGGHKTNNCGLKFSFYFGLGHIEDMYWKKFTKGLPTTMNFLEVLVDDEEATLA
jgi:hypothetical protein